MAWFGFGKERGIVDLSEKYRLQKEKSERLKKQAEEEKAKAEQSTGGFFPFFATPDAIPSSNSSSSSEPISTNIENSGIDAAERRKRLAKRIKDMTERMEELSNLVYHLQQRVDLLEKRSRGN